jgi:hypothetical protein
MMTNDKLFKTSLLLCAALAFAAPLPALAGSSAASSASDSLSTSVGSISTSIEKSSASSTTDEKKVADGDYQLLEMAELAERPGMLRLRLQALAGADKQEFFLLLPRQAAEAGRLAEGKIVTAQQRPYGLEFAAAETKAAFFLVLDDAWHRELQSHPVVL